MFLSTSEGTADAELMLPVLPKPRRLLMFDSEQPHMAKPPAIISEPFAPSFEFNPKLASTRVAGNRFAVVTRSLCGRRTSAEMVADFDKNGDGGLDRTNASVRNLRSRPFEARFGSFLSDGGRRPLDGRDTASNDA